CGSWNAARRLAGWSTGALASARSPMSFSRPSRPPIDRTSFPGAAAIDALDTALNAIDAPALIVDLCGNVLHANANARALLQRDRRKLSRALIEAIAGMPCGALWDLTPLRGAKTPSAFLAIFRDSRRAGS